MDLSVQNLFWFFPLVRYLQFANCQMIKNVNAYTAYSIFSSSAYFCFLFFIALMVGAFFEHPVWQFFKEVMNPLAKEFLLILSIEHTGQVFIFENSSQLFSEILGFIVGVSFVLRSIIAYRNRKLHKHIYVYSCWEEARNKFFDFFINKVQLFNDLFSIHYRRILFKYILFLLLTVIFLKLLSVSTYILLCVVLMVSFLKALFVVFILVKLKKYSFKNTSAFITNNELNYIVIMAYSNVFFICSFFVLLFYILIFDKLFLIEDNYILNGGFKREVHRLI